MLREAILSTCAMAALAASRQSVSQRDWEDNANVKEEVKAVGN